MPHRGIIKSELHELPLKVNNFKRMKENNEKLEMKASGPVWKPKIGIHSGFSEDTILFFRKSKRWEINIILN